MMRWALDVRRSYYHDTDTLIKEFKNINTKKNDFLCIIDCLKMGQNVLEWLKELCIQQLMSNFHTVLIIVIIIIIIL